MVLSWLSWMPFCQIFAWFIPLSERGEMFDVLLLLVPFLLSCPMQSEPPPRARVRAYINHVPIGAIFPLLISTEGGTRSDTRFCHKFS